MNDWKMTTCFMIFTVLSYYIGFALHKKYKLIYTTPVVLSTFILSFLFWIFSIDYSQYTQAKENITMFLGPATVAMAVPLYRNRKLLFSYLFPLLAGCLIGSLSSVITASVILHCFSLSKEMMVSMSLKSVTAPVALELANIISANPEMTVIFVITSGIFGVILGPFVMNFFNMKNDLSRGVALGSISHGIGTAYAFSESETTGTFSAVSMGLTAFITSFIAPYLVLLLTL